MMNKKIMFFLTLLSIIIISACSNSIKAPLVNVSGRVVDNENNLPIAETVVKIDNNYTKTNRDGYFIMTVRGNRHVNLLVYNLDYRPEEKSLYLGTRDSHLKDIRLIYNGGNARVTGKITISGSSLTNRLQTNNSNFPAFPLKTNYSDTGLEYVEGEILVKFKENINLQNTIQTLNTKGTIMSLNDKNTICKVKSNGLLNTDELYEYYNNLESVEKTSYNYIGYLMETPNDSFYPLQWHFDNIRMPTAWDIETGSDLVTVAVIDTGYLPHQDLIENIDIYNDYDFTDKDNIAYDDDASYEKDIASHGTHVAGIIGAVGNNDRGVTGVNWNINILPLRIFDGEYFTTDKLVEAIYYAVDKEASVINLSLAYITDYFGSLPDINKDKYWMVEEALAYANKNRVTVVAAAGNGINGCGQNYVFYPASSEYTIAVGATDIHNNLTSYSNYGEGLDLLAPGGSDTDYNNDGYIDGILSTHKFPNNSEYDYTFMTGTSMAAPQVSGVAALLVAQGIRHPYEIKDILTGTSTPLDDSRLSGAGLLNAAEALADTPGHGGFLNVKVFAVYLENDRYTHTSNVTGADYEGYYDLAYVEPNKDLYILAWIDENKNNEFDSEDNFGTSEHFYLGKNEHKNNVNISIIYQSAQSINDQTIQQINHLLQTP